MLRLHLVKLTGINRLLKPVNLTRKYTVSVPSFQKVPDVAKASIHIEPAVENPEILQKRQKPEKKKKTVKTRKSAKKSAKGLPKKSNKSDNLVEEPVKKYFDSEDVMRDLENNPYPTENELFEISNRNNIFVNDLRRWFSKQRDIQNLWKTEISEENHSKISKFVIDSIYGKQDLENLCLETGLDTKLVEYWLKLYEAGPTVVWKGKFDAIMESSKKKDGGISKKSVSKLAKKLDKSESYIRKYKSEWISQNLKENDFESEDLSVQTWLKNTKIDPYSAAQAFYDFSEKHHPNSQNTKILKPDLSKKFSLELTAIPNNERNLKKYLKKYLILKSDADIPDFNSFINYYDPITRIARAVYACYISPDIDARISQLYNAGGELLNVNELNIGRKIQILVQPFLNDRCYQELVVRKMYELELRKNHQPVDEIYDFMDGMYDEELQGFIENNRYKSEKLGKSEYKSDAWIEPLTLEEVSEKRTKTQDKKYLALTNPDHVYVELYKNYVRKDIDQVFTACKKLGIDYAIDNFWDVSLKSERNLEMMSNPDIYFRMDARSKLATEINNPCNVFHSQLKKFSELEHDDGFFDFENLEIGGNFDDLQDVLNEEEGGNHGKLMFSRVLKGVKYFQTHKNTDFQTKLGGFFKLRSLIEFWVHHMQNSESGPVLSTKFVENTCADLTFSNNLQHYNFSSEHAEYIKEISFHRDFLDEDSSANSDTPNSNTITDFFDVIALNETLVKSIVESISGIPDFYSKTFVPKLKKYKSRSEFWSGTDVERDDFLIKTGYIPKHIGPDFPELNHEPDFQEKLKNKKFTGKIYKKVKLRNPLTGEFNEMTLVKEDKLTKNDWDLKESELNEEIEEEEPVKPDFVNWKNKSGKAAENSIWKTTEIRPKRMAYLKHYSDQDHKYTVDEFKKFREHRYEGDLEINISTVHGRIATRVPEIVENEVKDKWHTSRNGIKFKETAWTREKFKFDETRAIRHLEFEEHYNKTGNLHPEKIGLIRSSGTANRKKLPFEGK